MSEKAFSYSKKHSQDNYIRIIEKAYNSEDENILGFAEKAVFATKHDKITASDTFFIFYPLYSENAY